METSFYHYILLFTIFLFFKNYLHKYNKRLPPSPGFSTEHLPNYPKNTVPFCTSNSDRAPSLLCPLPPLPRNASPKTTSLLPTVPGC
ncbi:hypothetical protein ACFX2I_043136 [Malus domestica]